MPHSTPLSWRFPVIPNLCRSLGGQGDYRISVGSRPSVTLPSPTLGDMCIIVQEWPLKGCQPPVQGTLEPGCTDLLWSFGHQSSHRAWELLCRVERAADLPWEWSGWEGCSSLTGTMHWVQHAPALLSQELGFWGIISLMITSQVTSKQFYFP